jgi:chlorite dismutase
MPRPLFVSFQGGGAGQWHVDRIGAVRGDGLAPVDRLRVAESTGVPPVGVWTLRGVTSNERYVERRERSALSAVQQPLGRDSARCAALIPISKSDEWWDLTQDERRAIFEDQAHHIAIGLDYLPAIARRLHHSRDLGEPFDFLTWFEFAPEASAQFDDLLGRLRATEEWAYVDREVEVRLSR